MEHPVSREEFNRLDKQVNGNGQPGMKQDIALCVSQLDAIRGAQDERAKIDARRWVIMTILLSALTLLVGIMGLFEANKQAHSGILRWPQIPHKTLSEPQYKMYANYQKPPEVSGSGAPHY